MALKDFVKKLSGNILYFPGCLTKDVLKKEFENYKEIFNKLGINYITLSEDESCCGLPVLNAGYRKDARKVAKDNYKLFKERKVYKIITSCPSCYHMFKSVYPGLVREWDIEVVHATVAIFDALKKKRMKKGPTEKVTYHDPCHLGRYEGIYDEPRKVIEMLGGEIIEMKYSREKSYCCGGGGGLRANFESTVKKIITPCGLCYSQLREGEIDTQEFSTYVLEKLTK
jgi:heterodisulfide reductase subunit D